MQRNLVLAFLLSISILSLWEMFVMRRFAPPPQVRHVQGLAPSPYPDQPSRFQGLENNPPSTPSKAGEQTIMVETENNQSLLLNLGAAVESWKVKANGKWVEMVWKKGVRRPLTTFDDLLFEARTLGPHEVEFEGRTSTGLKVYKRIVLGGGFLHEMTLTIENNAAGPVDANITLGWDGGLGTDERAMADNARDLRPLADNGQHALALRSGPHEGNYRWFGIDNRYFLAAFIPSTSAETHLIVETAKGQPPVIDEDIAVHLGSHERWEKSYRIYLGPKSYETLKALQLDLEHSINYGTFVPLGKALFLCLEWLHRATHNYGWSIILITIALQIMLLPLTMHSFRLSARMRELQPLVQKLQAQFKEDPKRMNVEMMNLYQKNGLKFMGMEGCFPMLLQLPFFWAFYTVLRNSYELRGAPWLGWITDLSIRDPYYILPILMGLGMLLQQKYSGTPGADPAQAKMMMLMPLFFVFIFFKLPSGLVLYWFTNSLMSMTIQRVMMVKHKARQQELGVARSP